MDRTFRFGHSLLALSSPVASGPMMLVRCAHLLDFFRDAASALWLQITQAARSDLTVVDR